MAKQSKSRSSSVRSKETGEKATKPAKAASVRHLTSLEEKIVKLLQEHAKCAGEIQRDRPKAMENRLNQLIGQSRIAQLLEKTPGPLDKEAIGAFFRELVSAEKSASIHAASRLPGTSPQLQPPSDTSTFRAIR